MRGLCTLLLCACHATLPVRWLTPATVAPQFPEQAGQVDPRIKRSFIEGFRIPATLAANLFPEVEIDPHFARWVELRATHVAVSEDRLLLDNLRIRFFDARGDPIETGICTTILVGFHSVLALRASEIRVEPPCGAWVPEGRYVLRRVCPVMVAMVEEAGRGEGDANPIDSDSHRGIPPSP